MLKPGMRATDRMYLLQSRFCRKCTSWGSREACPYCVVEKAIQRIVVEDMRGTRVEMREAGT